MTDLVKLTQFLYSSMILADPDKGYLETGPGVVDHMLKEAKEQKVLPAWAADQLVFIDGYSGLECLQSGDLQRLATVLKFTDDPNPSYTRAQIAVSPSVARLRLSKLGISEKDAVECGTVLRKAAEKWSQQLEESR